MNLRSLSTLLIIVVVIIRAFVDYGGHGGQRSLEEPFDPDCRHY